MCNQLNVMSFTVNDFYKSVVLKLKVLYPAEEARAMSDRLFEHYFNLSPTQRVLSGTTLTDGNKIQLLEEAVEKLLHNIPLQYILGTAFFMDMEFVVSSSVLIPRPETEELVSLIIKQYSNRKTDPRLNILDIGTGSGCIAISLKRYLPQSSVSALDISHEALKVASENAEKNEVKINLIRTDILDQSHWDEMPQFDLIVSNPPYVTNAEKEQMHLNVLEHEPHTALFVSDEDPLLFYREIMKLAKIKLCEGGSLWFEINEMFGHELKNMAVNQGFKDVIIISDIHKKERFLQARI